MTRLVFLLEERSMEALLDEILPRILPQGVTFLCIPHEGKQDLARSIPRKLRAWQYPGDRFVILHDQDSADCHSLKQQLQTLCGEAGRPDVLVRIVCRELESWFLGDLKAVAQAFQVTGLEAKQGNQKYRRPDDLNNAGQELKRLVKQYQKCSGAQKIASYMGLDGENCSISFRVFIAGLRRLCQ